MRNKMIFLALPLSVVFITGVGLGFHDGGKKKAALTQQRVRLAKDEMICDDCRKDNFQNYVSCSRVCDLCTVDCCKAGADRCCCLHRRDDCFTVCVAKSKTVNR